MGWQIGDFMKLFGKKHRGKARTDRKLHSIGTAAGRLLAHKDYDAILMAEVAREAGCSVGALYARFPDKHALLASVIGGVFRGMRNEASLGPDQDRQSHTSAADQIKDLIGNTVSAMASPRAAGAIRAVIKLTSAQPDAIKTFEGYRTDMTERAVGLLSADPKVAPGAVRIGMQIVLATVTDAILQKRAGPMAAGSDRMKAALANVMIGYLGISMAGRWAGAEAEAAGKDKVSPLDEIQPKSEPRKLQVDAGTFRPKTKKAGKSRSGSGLDVPVKTETPVKVPPPNPKASISGDSSRPKRKQRHI
jgi:AcrR family transcriptional regulator